MSLFRKIKECTTAAQLDALIESTPTDLLEQALRKSDVIDSLTIRNTRKYNDAFLYELWLGNKPAVRVMHALADPSITVTGLTLPTPDEGIEVYIGLMTAFQLTSPTELVNLISKKTGRLDKIQLINENYL